MGAVYRAQQPMPRREVALKVIRSTILSDASIERFKGEIEVLGSLRHPGIATIYDAGVTEGDVPAPYFSMELVDGQSINAHARSSRLSFGNRVRLVAQIARALQHSHERGVIHGDLKPANILVDAEGQPKILDFGIATLRRPELDGGAPPAIIGTPAYMSPEQLAGEAIDARSDVYSLGLIARKLLNEAPSVKSAGWSRDVRAIVEQMTAEARDDRPPSAKAVAERLERAITARQGRSLKWTVSAAAAIVGAVLIWSALKPEPPKPVLSEAEVRLATLMTRLLPGEADGIEWGPLDRQKAQRGAEKLEQELKKPIVGVDEWENRWRLIRTLWQLGELERAEAAAREALDRSFEEQHSGPRMLAAIHLGGVLVAAGDTQGAIDVFHTVDESRGLGGLRPSVVAARFLASYARTLMAAGRADQADRLLAEAEGILDPVLENSHPLLVKVRKDRAALSSASERAQPPE